MTVGNSDQYGVCWSLLSDRASRAMAYVGMTRGRDENHLASGCKEACTAAAVHDALCGSTAITT